QTEDFIGLNTPMCTFFVISLPYLVDDFSFINHPAFLISAILILSLLLVSEIKLFSMKLKGLSWNENKYKFSFIILSVLLLVCLQFAAIPLILLAYLVFSKIHF